MSYKFSLFDTLQTDKIKGEKTIEKHCIKVNNNNSKSVCWLCSTLIIKIIYHLCFSRGGILPAKKLVKDIRKTESCVVYSLHALYITALTGKGLDI